MIQALQFPLTVKKDTLFRGENIKQEISEVTEKCMSLCV
jgi:hypothetical protein